MEKGTISKLLLASSSPIRQQLLQEAGLSFRVIEHSFDESLVDKCGNHEAVVKMLAQCKARSVDLSDTITNTVFVVAADTLVASQDGVLFGKPRDYDDAVEMLKQIRSGARVVTGVCCRRLERIATSWHLVSERCEEVGADVFLDLPDAWIPVYLALHKDFLCTAGALAVERFGAQFVTSIRGSYTAVLGLPMAEVRRMLEELDFFEPINFSI